MDAADGFAMIVSLRLEPKPHRYSTGKTLQVVPNSIPPLKEGLCTFVDAADGFAMIVSLRLEPKPHRYSTGKTLQAVPSTGGLSEGLSLVILAASTMRGLLLLLLLPPAQIRFKSFLL